MFFFGAWPLWSQYVMQWEIPDPRWSFRVLISFFNFSALSTLSTCQHIFQVEFFCNFHRASGFSSLSHTFTYFHIFSIFHDRNSIKAATRGSWRTVVVDDVVPADCNRPGWPRACRPNGPLWPSVIEKAFAKACGGYEKMDFVPRKKKFESW